MPKLLIANDDADVDSEDSEDDASISEGCVLKLLIRKEQKYDKHFQKELKWENLSDADYGMRDLQGTKLSKDKEQVL